METGDREQNEAGNLGREQVTERATAHGRRAGREQQLLRFTESSVKRTALTPNGQRILLLRIDPFSGPHRPHIAPGQFAII